MQIATLPCLSSQTYAKKEKKNPQPNPNGFAYIRAALGLTQEISFDTINALAFSMSRHIRIEHNICYIVVFLYIKFESETSIFRYFEIILIITY